MTSTSARPVVTVNGVERPHDGSTSVAALVTELLGGAPESVSGPGRGPGSPHGVAPTGDARHGDAPTGDARHGDAPTGVAVAVDDAIVPRGLWATTHVPAGARVEVVTAVQGG